MEGRTMMPAGTEVPTMGGHPWWLGVLPAVIFGLLYVIDSPDRHTPLWTAFYLVWLVWAVVFGWGASPERVTLDGTTVQVHRRWSTTRFELTQIRAVIETSWSGRGPLRVDGAERWLFGRRVPRLAPWPQMVTTSVHPAFWVRRAGVPESLVRGGGLLARRRGLR